MANDKKIGRGSLSPAKERKSDKSPNLMGSMTLEEDLSAGTKVWLAGWTKIGDDGGKWISISVSKPDSGQRGYTPRAPMRSEMDDEIPFAPEWRG